MISVSRPSFELIPFSRKTFLTYNRKKLFLKMCQFITTSNKLTKGNFLLEKTTDSQICLASLTSLGTKRHLTSVKNQKGRKVV